jgi:hypothetical protein
MRDRTKYNEYMREYMSKRKQAIRDQERIRREAERGLIEYEARKADADFFPLMAGYKAAERGQPCEKRQTGDWKRGWTLYHRQNAGAE